MNVSQFSSFPLQYTSFSSSILLPLYLAGDLTLSNFSLSFLPRSYSHLLEFKQQFDISLGPCYFLGLLLLLPLIFPYFLLAAVLLLGLAFYSLHLYLTTLRSSPFKDTLLFLTYELFFSSFAENYPWLESFLCVHTSLLNFLVSFVFAMPSISTNFCCSHLCFFFKQNFWFLPFHVVNLSIFLVYIIQQWQLRSVSHFIIGLHSSSYHAFFCFILSYFLWGCRYH